MWPECMKKRRKCEEKEYAGRKREGEGEDMRTKEEGIVV